MRGTLFVTLAADVFYNVAVVIRIVGGVWANLDPRTLEAAQMLGAGRLRRFTSVTLPLIAPAVLSASALGSVGLRGADVPAAQRSRPRHCWPEPARARPRPIAPAAAWSAYSRPG